METKHTQGPWLDKSGEVYAEETGRTIARCDIGGHDETSEANARLIAAAPDLLAALEGMIGHLPDCFEIRTEVKELRMSIPKDIFERARAAIARAKGEA